MRGATIALAVPAAVLGGCVDREGIFGPAPGGGAEPVVQLGGEAVTLFDEDSLAFRLGREVDAPVRVRAVLVDSAHRVVWRSDPSQPARRGSLGVVASGISELARPGFVVVEIPEKIISTSRGQ